ncbi:MAG: leucine-rich repeat domain-containing protein [Candidatus Poribacteria bacterium]|nr:leucine-rich repeat domain-containing protein [Candidatus Poribacteria bacterium]
MKNFTKISLIFTVIFGYQTADAQQNLAQQAYAIFERNCLNCHGEHGAFTEEIIIDHTALIKTGAVVPGQPIASELYKRLFAENEARRMPLGQPKLPDAAIRTIRNWIQAGAPDWEGTAATDATFITPKKMLDTIEKHVNSLRPFDRTFARYFTLTHLYNAGETTEALHAYQRALSKLVNSLSWGREVIKPKPIDPEETLFYIDLRDYEWEIGTNRWTLIEAEYPYEIEFNAPTQTALYEKLTNLREAMDCEVPFIHVDWFLATASLPPLYNDILNLPETDQELETRLEVNVVENIRNAPGKRVWRAGFSDSGVSNHNRVVERHTSRYGAYWKSYDFAGSVGTQNIFTHPLSFTHDGGEVIFNLPNGLQAYYLSDAGGRRLDEAPINIVRNPAASDPTVRNGLSCIGCHTEGMKDFEDQVRGVVQKNPNPPFNKDRALQLYTDKATMAGLLAEDTDRYKQALRATGDVFGGIEPVHRFHEAFQRPVNAAYAAAAVGLETETFLQKVRASANLKSLGVLVLENGTMKRDTWTSKFSEIVFALDFPDVVISVDQQTERIPGASVYIPDPNLRAFIEEELGKTPNAPITVEEMATLHRIFPEEKGISDLTGLEFATNLEWLKIQGNQISDLSPIAGLTKLDLLDISGNEIRDLSPLTGLKNLRHVKISHNNISDLSPLAQLPTLNRFDSWGNPLSDLSPLVELEVIDICGGELDISTLAGAKNLKELYLLGGGVSDVSPLAKLTKLTRLGIAGNNNVSDISPLAELTGLKWLELSENSIVDVSPLTKLKNLTWLHVGGNEISDFSPLDEFSKDVTIINHTNPGFPEGGPKIEGPWLWVLLPNEDIQSIVADKLEHPNDDLLTHLDVLAEASGGKVTELKVSTHGATEGNPVGDKVWWSDRIPPTGRNNIAEVLPAEVLAGPFVPGVIYGCVVLYSPRQQEVTLFAGNDGGGKAWLNGVLVHEKLKGARGEDYQHFVPVTLKKGKNVLLVATRTGGNGFWGFNPEAEYTVLNPRVGYAFSQPIIETGDTFTLEIRAEDVGNLGGWQFDITYDPAVLEAVEVNEGDFLKTGGGATFFQRGTIDNRLGKIKGLSAARLGEDGVSGTGTLLSLTFTAKSVGQTQLKLNNFQLAAITGKPITVEAQEIVITVEGKQTTGDVNRDGQVSILDLVLVARHFGKTVPAHSEADINGDGVINVLDLILVSQNMGGSNGLAAPSMLSVDDIDRLNPVIIQAWIERAHVEDDGSIAFQEGIANLQRLLASLIPKETVLLPNYPNPFNPETWIPYHLANPSDVTITIYDTRGSIVRRLDLGHQREGYYTSRGRAAYWDGRNAVGERVASGVYFYQLQVDHLSLLRKMIVLK